MKCRGTSAACSFRARHRMILSTPVPFKHFAAPLIGHAHNVVSQMLTVELEHFNTDWLTLAWNPDCLIVKVVFLACTNNRTATLSVNKVEGRQKPYTTFSLTLSCCS